MTLPKRKRVGGFLLLEAAVTTALVAIILLWLVRSFSSTVTALQAASRYSTAVRLAEEYLCRAATCRPAVRVGQAEAGVEDVGDVSYTWRVEAARGSSDGVAHVQASVTWTDRRGAQRVRLNTDHPSES